MNEQGHGIGSFLGRMMRSDVTEAVNTSFGSLLDITPHVSSIDDEVEEALQLTEGEELWLTDHLDADEELDPLEKALLAFIAEETGLEVR